MTRFKTFSLTGVLAVADSALLAAFAWFLFRTSEAAFIAWAVTCVVWGLVAYAEWERRKSVAILTRLAGSLQSAIDNHDKDPERD